MSAVFPATWAPVMMNLLMHFLLSGILPAKDIFSIEFQPCGRKVVVLVGRSEGVQLMGNLHLCLSG